MFTSISECFYCLRWSQHNDRDYKMSQLFLYAQIIDLRYLNYARDRRDVLTTTSETVMTIKAPYLYLLSFRRTHGLWRAASCVWEHRYIIYLNIHCTLCYNMNGYFTLHHDILLFHTRSYIVNRMSVHFIIIVY